MGGGQILFSIVIPTYNRREKLRDCLSSVLRQSYKNYEIIVCDDGSTDNSKAVVDEFQDQEININYIYTENWGGPARPRNLGIAAATGEWICFLDSDDSWYEDKLEQCAHLIDNADIIYHDLDMEMENGHTKRMRTRQLAENAFRDLLINGNAISTSTVCARKTLLIAAKGFSEDTGLVAVEDYDLWIRLAERKYRFIYLPQSLGRYWVGGGNITSKDTIQIARIDKVYGRYLYLLSEKDRKYAGRMKSYKLAKVYHQIANYRQAISEYKRSMFASSISIRLKSIFFMIKAALKLGT